jgi:hypothetical protein
MSSNQQPSGGAPEGGRGHQADGRRIRGFVAQVTKLRSVPTAPALGDGRSDPGAYVDAWAKEHPQVVAQWVKDNSATP